MLLSFIKTPIRRRIALACLIVSSAWGGLAFAQSTSGASIKGATPVELRQMVLKNTCHVLLPSEASLPCNPAFLPYVKDRKFSANIFLGENYERVNAYRKDIENKNELGVVEKLFEENGPLQVRVGSALWAKSQYFSFTYVPLHVSYFSDFRNRAFPEVDLKIFVEKGFQSQGAIPIALTDSSLNIGLQLRGVDRQSVFQKVTLFDVLSDPKTLQIEQHETIYLEPGLVWMYESDWRPRMSVFAQNIQVYHSGARTPSELSGSFVDWGSGFSVPVTYGHWDLGLNYRMDPDIAGGMNRLQLGTGYSLGLMQTNFALAKDSYSIGVATSFLSARTGVAFFSDNVREWDGSEKRQQTVTLEFGLVF